MQYSETCRNAGDNNSADKIRGKNPSGKTSPAVERQNDIGISVNYAIVHNGGNMRTADMNEIFHNRWRNSLFTPVYFYDVFLFRAVFPMTKV